MALGVKDPWTTEGALVKSHNGQRFRVRYRDGWRYLDPVNPLEW